MTTFLFYFSIILLIGFVLCVKPKTRFNNPHNKDVLVNLCSSRGGLP